MCTCTFFALGESVAFSPLLLSEDESLSLLAEEVMACSSDLGLTSILLARIKSLFCKSLSMCVCVCVCVCVCACTSVSISVYHHFTYSSIHLILSLEPIHIRNLHVKLANTGYITSAALICSIAGAHSRNCSGICCAISPKCNY